MNKWQSAYLNDPRGGCAGKMPRSKRGKEELELLGHVKETVTVSIPDFEGIRGFVPAHDETYVVTEFDCNMPEGRISARVLASNLVFWLSNGYKVTTASVGKGA